MKYHTLECIDYNDTSAEEMPCICDGCDLPPSKQTRKVTQ